MAFKQQQFKAIISNHGDESLHQSLSGEIERRLPTVPISWSRSHGRPSKDICLQAVFMKFDVSQLKSGKEAESNRGMASKPLLHIFWTSCLDNDKYKSGLKTQIVNWQKSLIENRITNWLIVHVLYQDIQRSNKSKINLPRSSVYDKIKSDFCQRSQDRCIQLWEPDKETLFTKSGESWDALLSSLRNLLLESFGQNLDLFQDRVRVMREKYADPEWPFLSYFSVHEDLALTYQSITLREDALIAYDEVDALLSQFIINSTGRALPRWLERFCLPPTNWDGVSVSTQNLNSYREVIMTGNATLLDFRNYVFSRQCKLLALINKKAEIPSRMMEFIYMFIQEVKLLKIEMPEGSLDCWIVLTCMQLFQVLETVEQKDYEFKSTYAHLYNYMREKLHHLGEITGLYYNRGQTEEEIEVSNVLISGFGKYPSRKKEMPSSIKLLKVALTSKVSYETLYLEMANKTIQLMTDLNRQHFGMYVKIYLAKFHLQYGRYDDAETLLETAWSIYKQQKWETLYTDVLIPLADCQLKHNLISRYLNSITLLSCASCLPIDKKYHYSNELLKFVNADEIKSLTLATDPVIKIQDIKMELVKNKGHMGDCVRATFILSNELPIDLPCTKIFIVLKHSDLNNPKSFSDHVTTPKTFSFSDQPDTGVSVSLSLDEKSKEAKEPPKESLTPSNIFRKIKNKSHRRTWSRANGDITIEETNSLNSSPNSSRSASVYLVNSWEASSAKKALFADEKPLGISNLDKASSLPNLSVLSHDDSSEVSDSEDKEDTAVAADIDKDQKSLSLPPNGVVVPYSIEEHSIDGCSEEQGNVDLAHIQLDVAQLQGVIAPSEIKVSGDMCLETIELDIEDTATSTPKITDLMIPIDIEEEVNLDQELESEENFILSPGCNTVELKSVIRNEGKYVLHCINCIVGNLTFYKLLTQLPKNNQSFYIVADPPKVVWTTDYIDTYLLTTVVQRLHITMVNGPGSICDGSILQISSLTGLTFQTLTLSSIQIYPLERDGPSREAAISGQVFSENLSGLILHLPECKPYERVNLFFDIKAPPRIDVKDSHITKHQLNFKCNWLDGLVDSSVVLDCVFSEPFDMDYETIQKGNNIFVRVVLHGLNPVHLTFTSPSLTCSSEDTFELLSNDSASMYGYEDCYFLWKLNLSKVSLDISESLQCKFCVNFKNDVGSEDVGSFSQSFCVTFTKCLYSVDVMFRNSISSFSQPCSATVRIKKLQSESASYRLFLILNTQVDVWRYAEQSKEYHEVTFQEESPHEFTVEVSVLADGVGCVSAPAFFLAKLDVSEIGEVDHILDSITSFKYGQVSYKQSGNNFDDEDCEQPP